MVSTETAQESTLMINFLFCCSVLLITLPGIWFWFQFYSRRFSPGCNTSGSPLGLVDVLFAFFAWLVIPGILVAIQMAIWQTANLESIDPQNMNRLIVLTAVGQLLASAAAVLLCQTRYQTTAMLFGDPSNWRSRSLVIAAKAFCMVVPAILALQAVLSMLVPYKHATLDQLAENFSAWTMLATWFGAVLAAPVCEEILFRGMLQGWLQRIKFGAAADQGFAELLGGWPNSRVDGGCRISADEEETGPAPSRQIQAAQFPVPPVEALKVPEFDRENPFAATSANSGQIANENRAPGIGRIGWWMPVVASALMFALVHVGQGLAPISLFFFGIALGFLYRYTGSIIPSILLHMMLNAFSMFWVTLDSAIG